VLGEIRTAITPRGETATFHLAFSQKNLTESQMKLTGSVFCAIAGEDTKVQTWMATRSALENPEYRDQDGLCQGEFIVHVEVSTEYGQRSRNDIVIKCHLAFKSEKIGSIWTPRYQNADVIKNRGLKVVRNASGVQHQDMMLSKV
jgi:hypothetical protein